MSCILHAEPMTPTDAPKPVTTPDRKTSDACGDKVHHGIECMRPVHHEGHHECYPPTGESVRWT